MGPIPIAVLPVGITVHVVIEIHVVWCERSCIGIVAMMVCSVVHVGPMSVGTHPVYSFSLVVRRSALGRLRRDSYRCSELVVSVRV